MAPTCGPTFGRRWLATWAAGRSAGRRWNRAEPAIGNGLTGSCSRWQKPEQHRADPGSGPGAARRIHRLAVPPRQPPARQDGAVHRPAAAAGQVRRRAMSRRSRGRVDHREPPRETARNTIQVPVPADAGSERSATKGAGVPAGTVLQEPARFCDVLTALFAQGSELAARLLGTGLACSSSSSTARATGFRATSRGCPPRTRATGDCWHKPAVHEQLPLASRCWRLRPTGRTPPAIATNDVPSPGLHLRYRSNHATVRRTRPRVLRFSKSVAFTRIDHDGRRNAEGLQRMPEPCVCRGGTLDVALSHPRERRRVEHFG